MIERAQMLFAKTSISSAISFVISARTIIPPLIFLKQMGFLRFSGFHIPFHSFRIFQERRRNTRYLSFLPPRVEFTSLTSDIAFKHALKFLSILGKNFKRA